METTSNDKVLVQDPFTERYISVDRFTKKYSEISNFIQIYESEFYQTEPDHQISVALNDVQKLSLTNPKKTRNFLTANGCSFPTAEEEQQQFLVNTHGLEHPWLYRYITPDVFIKELGKYFNPINFPISEHYQIEADNFCCLKNPISTREYLIERGAGFKYGFYSIITIYRLESLIDMIRANTTVCINWKNVNGILDPTNNELITRDEFFLRFPLLKSEKNPDSVFSIYFGQTITGALKCTSNYELPELIEYFKKCKNRRSK